MTDIAVVERVVAALCQKFRYDEHWGYDEKEEWLCGVVQTVVCDTMMIMDGTLTVEDFE